MRKLGDAVTPWDTRAALRALLLALTAFGVAWLVTATTDEGGVAWGARAGRTLPFAPVCAALGTAIALQQARGRGEVRALEALGRAPWKNALAVVVGGAAAALLAAVLMGASTKVDVEGFYPVPTHGATFRYEAGGFVQHALGLRVEADGAIARFAPDEPATPGAERIPRHGRAAAALTTAFAGLALAAMAAHFLLTRPLAQSAKARSTLGSADAWRATLLVLAMATASILLFHAAAAGRVPALLAPLPAVLLLARTVLRYRSGYRSVT